MAKQQLNARISNLTRYQLDELCKRWGTTQTETLTVIIDRIYQQEIQTMINDTTYYIDEQMLGEDATEQDAHRMVELLTEMGHNVAYGHALNQDASEIATHEWEHALDVISQENQA